MASQFGAICDDFNVSSRLFLKLEMPLERDTILHFFDRIKRQFPEVNRLRRRGDESIILEEEPQAEGTKRWIRLDVSSLRFGCFAPTNLEAAREFHDLILEQAPYHFSFSSIDFDHFDLVYGFDLEYRGNHDQLLAETFWSDHPLAGFLFGEEAAHIIDAQPYLGISLTPNCELQAYVEVKSRTSSYEIRSTDFEAQQMSVMLTLRRYWGVSEDVSLAEAQRTMFQQADSLAADKVVPLLVNPLATAIAGRP
jgi:hypothetical protein